jgi:hypothetical protein
LASTSPVVGRKRVIDDIETRWTGLFQGMAKEKRHERDYIEIDINQDKQKKSDARPVKDQRCRATESKDRPKALVAFGRFFSGDA